MKVRNTRRVFKLSMATTVLLITASCSSLPFTSADERWAGYKSWTKITEQRPAVGDPTGYLDNVHLGREGYRDVYVNETGRPMLTGMGPYNFPVGTVIVKEQFKSQKEWLIGEDPQVTVSLKTSNTPGRANWEWSPSYKGKAADNKFCAGCHSHALQDDFVFTHEKFLSSQK